jgi:hypothetical protein
VTSKQKGQHKIVKKLASNFSFKLLLQNNLKSLHKPIKKLYGQTHAYSSKGYSTTRQCQEVLISVLDIISNCKHQNRRGAVLSLDIRKAFDTVSHQYMKKVFEFFNFGPYISKWLTIL